MAHFVQRLSKAMRYAAMRKLLIWVMAFFVVLHSSMVFARAESLCCMDECPGLSQCLSTACHGCLTQALQTKSACPSSLMKSGGDILFLQRPLEQFVEDIWKPPNFDQACILSTSFNF